MADVFSQLYIQIVFAVKHRKSLILPEWEENLYGYTTGVIQQRGHKLLAINGMPDHIHIFIGQKPAEALSELVREIKNATNDYINENRLSTHKFDWQSGYGAFSYSRSQLGTVCNYIANQKMHHQKTSFRDEYLDFIHKFEIEVGKKQLFDFFD